MQNVGPRKKFLEFLGIYKDSLKSFQKFKKMDGIVKFSPPRTYAFLYYYRKWKNINTPIFNKMSCREINKKNKEFMKKYPNHGKALYIIPSKKEK